MGTRCLAPVQPTGGGGEFLMTAIRAFVGHSFTEDDEEVVRRFTDYFDSLSKSGMNFSWTHAVPAEPKILADKVKSLISEKNLFIGICTKKERVIPNASLKPALFHNNVLIAPESEFSWKTSDWIIQEIGLAIGNELDLVLLIEEGVRPPGGLQSDVEYITFDRTAPERSFKKIVEMITALSPRTQGPVASSDEVRSRAAEEETETATPASDAWSTPAPDWGRHDYEFALFQMILAANTDGIEEISKAYLETADAEKGNSRNSWLARIEIERLKWGEGGNFRKVQRLAEENPDDSQILQYLAEAFEHYNDYAKAAATYEAAANKETEFTRALSLQGWAAEAYARNNTPEAASVIIDRMKAKVEESGDGELQLLRALLRISELAKEDVVSLAIMERVVEIDPSDTDTRFSIAYKYSSREDTHSALFHYLNIPNQERSAMTWNNLGVALDDCELRSKSVDAYRKSKQMGETLAMSNLARKFMQAGFLAEAQKECEEAFAIKDFHRNVGHISARLKSLPAEEEKKQEELLEKVKPKSDFFRLFGWAVAQSEPKELPESWEGPDGELNVTLRGQSFGAAGSFERSLSRLMTIVADRGTSSRGRTETIQVEYTGVLRGRAIEAKVTRNREGERARSASLLGSSENERAVLMVVADGEDQIRVMENPSASEPRFYVLRRKLAGT